MKVKELKSILINKINDGSFEQKKFPTEDQFLKQYDITRYALRRVIDELVDLGLVYKVQGSGVYIRESKREGYLPLSSTSGISSDMPNANVSTKLIQLEVKMADAQDMADFKCEKDNEIYHVTRLRMVDDEPFSLEYSRYNKKLIPYLNKEITETSIFKYINEALRLEIGFADKIIEGNKLSAYEAAHLQLEENDPAIIIYDTVYLKTGEIFDCSKVIYHYQKAKFFDLAKYKK